MAGAAGISTKPRSAQVTPQRQQLIRDMTALRAQWCAQIRHLVIELGRFDVLAREVLGLKVAPHHLELLRHQATYPDANMQLAFRGAGKTTTATEVYAIGLWLQDPERRLLLASRSGDNAADMGHEIKGFLENATFVEVFGDLRTGDWQDGSFTIATKKRVTKEPSFTAVGVESAVVSKHYDVILCDDLVDEKNAATPTVRQKTHTFFYKTLLPTLEPNGILSIRGTRYHPEDLYGHLILNEMAGPRTLIIPALRGNAEDGWISTWPEKWPVAKFLQLRKSMGTILFDTQYQCDAESMRGEIFDFDDFTRIEAGQVPTGLPIFLGVDLAISLKSTGHFFALVKIAWDAKNDYIYVLDSYESRLKFSDQTKKLIAWGYGGEGMEATGEPECERIGIETNAYQDAQAQNIKDTDPHLNLVKIVTDTDKRKRAWRLQPKTQDKRVFVVKSPQNDRFIEVMVKMPAEPDDLFDAFDHAVAATRSRTRTPREEPGLL